MFKFIENNSKLKEFMLDTASVAGYLWGKGMAESNAGNISANISDLITNTLITGYNQDTEKLLSNFSSLAGLYFFVSGAGKRMRDLSKDIFANSMIIKISDDGNSYFRISKDNNKDFFSTSELLTHLSLHQEFLKSGGINKIIGIGT